MDVLTIVAAASAFTGIMLITLGLYQARGGPSRAAERLQALEAYTAPPAEGPVPLALRERQAAWRERTLRELERAGIALKLHEYLILRGACALVLAAIGFLAVGPGPGVLVALLLAAVGFMLPAFYVRLRVNREMNKVTDQLEEMLTMVSGSLRAGFGLLQAFDLAAEQLQPPLSHELRRLIRDTRMGATLEQALQAMGQRVENYDLDMVITAVLIQRSVGSNLSEVLDNVAHTIRERARIKGEINTLTSQKKLSGWIVGLLPIALVGLIAITNPDYMSPLFTTVVGRLLLAVAVVMNLIGVWLIRRIVSIEV